MKVSLILKIFNLTIFFSKMRIDFIMKFFILDFLQFDEFLLIKKLKKVSKLKIEHFRMIPTSNNRGLKDTSSTSRLQTSLGKFSKLSTENRLLSCGDGTKSSTSADSSSLASKRRQELLSSLITEKRQKINLDLSNRLLNLNLKLQSKSTSSSEALGLTGLNLSR